jgi:hypothetical protein
MAAMADLQHIVAGTKHTVAGTQHTMVPVSIETLITDIPKQRHTIKQLCKGRILM